MATASPDVDLECPVCHEEFTEAKFLPCVHVVCSKCIVSWLSSKGQGGCPLCRAPILPTPQAGQGDVKSVVDKLPTDLATMALVESKRVLQGGHVCSVCENDVVATAFCLDCSAKLCSSCTKVHGKLPCSRDHVIENLDTLTADQLASKKRCPCTEHPDKPAELYCPQHTSLICLQCFTSSHEECVGVKSIASVAKQERAALTDKARILRDRETDMTTEIRKLERELQDVQAHFSSMRSEVKATFDRLQQMVEKRRQEVHVKLQEEEEKVVGPKQARKASLEEQKASIGAHAGSVERLVVPSPDSVLLGMLEKLRVRLHDLEKQTQMTPDCASTRLVSFTSDPATVKTLEDMFAAFGRVCTREEPEAEPKCAVCGHLKSAHPTGAELAKVLKPGDRVRRGEDWVYGNEDGPTLGPGTVTAGPAEKGWVTVQWDAGGSNQYRMDAEGCYDLQLACDSR